MIKKDYLNLGFLFLKPVYLLFLAVLFFIVGIMVDAFCPNDLSYIAPGILPAFWQTTNWYIWELNVFYILFFFIYKFIPGFRVCLFGVITVILAVIMYQQGFMEAYVASAFAFPAGLLWGGIFSTGDMCSYKGVITTTILAVFGVRCLLIKPENMISIVFMRNSLCLAVIMITFYFCNHFTLGNNPVARFLCRYSTEIYLAQFACRKLAKSYGWNYMIRMPFVLASTIMLAVIIHPIVLTVKKRLSMYNMKKH